MVRADKWARVVSKVVFNKRGLIHPKVTELAIFKKGFEPVRFMDGQPAYPRVQIAPCLLLARAAKWSFIIDYLEKIDCNLDL